MVRQRHLKDKNAAYRLRMFAMEILARVPWLVVDKDNGSLFLRQVNPLKGRDANCLHFAI